MALNNESMAKLALDERLLINRKDMLAELMRKFGGIEGVARLAYSEFETMELGSPPRREWLKLLINGVLTHGIDDEGDEDATPEEAAQDVRKLLKAFLRELDEANELDEFLDEVRGESDA